MDGFTNGTLGHARDSGMSCHGCAQLIVSRMQLTGQVNGNRVRIASRFDSAGISYGSENLAYCHEPLGIRKMGQSTSASQLIGEVSQLELPAPYLPSERSKA